MKNSFTLKNTTRSILIASTMLGLTGVVHAQSGTAKKPGGSVSNPSTYAYGKDAARDYARSQESASHTYGKDQAADYAQSQGSGSHTYGKNQSADYAQSQGAGSTGGRGIGMGSSSSQGSSTSGTSAGSGGY